MAGTRTLLWLILIGASVKFYAQAGLRPEIPVAVQTLTVSGQSMSPLLAEGSQVEVDPNYYATHPKRSGDIVIFQIRDQKLPLIKRICGVPGDFFSLAPNSDAGIWRILVNGKILRNSRGQEYRLKRESSHVLIASEKIHSGRIPEGSLLLLGDEPAGTLDSSRLGFIPASQIMGKVIGRLGERHRSVSGSF